MNVKLNTKILVMSLITLFTVINAAFATKAVKVFSKDAVLLQSSDIQPSFYVKNIGNETIASYTVYYYFTTENSKTPVLDDWNTPNSSLIMENLGGGEYRVKFEYSNVNLSPNQEITFGGNSWGLHYSDWSSWDKTNDYSSNLTSSFSENQKMVVYEQGQQDPLYGTPPNTNSAPVANNVSINGTAEIGVTLTGEYVYQDTDNDDEGQSTYQWYRAEDASGTNAAQIQGENNITYELKDDDYQKFIMFEVTPVASSGESPGPAAQSAYTSQVAGVLYKYPESAGENDNVKIDGLVKLENNNQFIHYGYDNAESKQVFRVTDGDLASPSFETKITAMNVNTPSLDVNSINAQSLRLDGDFSGECQIQLEGASSLISVGGSISGKSFSSTENIRGRKDLVLGNDDPNIDAEFIIHSRSHEQGDWLEFAYEDSNEPDGWAWGKGLIMERGGNVGIGKTDPESKLDVDGDINAGGTVMASNFKIGNWTIEAPDFVFDAEKYDLKPLADVKKFIDKERHLPGVPSASDMKKNGVELAEMSMTLLKKIEEMQLYILQQQEQLEKQQNEIDELKAK